MWTEVLKVSRYTLCQRSELCRNNVESIKIKMFFGVLHTIRRTTGCTKKGSLHGPPWSPFYNKLTNCFWYSPWHSPVTIGSHLSISNNLCICYNTRITPLTAYCLLWPNVSMARFPVLSLYMGVTSYPMSPKAQLLDADSGKSEVAQAYSCEWQHVFNTL